MPSCPRGCCCWSRCRCWSAQPARGDAVAPTHVGGHPAPDLEPRPRGRAPAPDGSDRLAGLDLHDCHRAEDRRCRPGHRSGERARGQPGHAGVRGRRYGGASGGRAQLSLSWPALVGVVYAAGVAVMLIALFVHRSSVRRCARRASDVRDPEWSRLLAECARDMGVRREVRLLRSREQSMPMTFGIRRPSILIPAIAGTWTGDRRRAVILHELAHIARRDCLTQTLAFVACAMYWFHPAVWWVARRLRIERELACDDRVIAAGTQPREYAGHLLEIAYSFGDHRVSAMAVSMARPHQLESRMLAALDDGRNRTVPPPRVRAAGTLVAATLLLAIAGATPTLDACHSGKRRPWHRRSRQPAGSRVAHVLTDPARRGATRVADRRRRDPGRAGESTRHVGAPSDREGRGRPSPPDGAELLERIERPGRSARRVDGRAAGRPGRAGSVPDPPRRRHVDLRGRAQESRRRGHVLVLAQSELPGGARQARVRPADGARAVSDGAARHRVCLHRRAEQAGVRQAADRRARSRRSARRQRHLPAGDGRARLPARLARPPDHAARPRRHARLRPRARRSRLQATPGRRPSTGARSRDHARVRARDARRRLRVADDGGARHRQGPRRHAGVRP